MANRAGVEAAWQGDNHMHYPEAKQQGSLFIYFQVFNIRILLKTKQNKTCN